MMAPKGLKLKVKRKQNKKGYFATLCVVEQCVTFLFFISCLNAFSMLSVLIYKLTAVTRLIHPFLERNRIMR